MFPYEGSKEFADGWFWPEEGKWYNKICKQIQDGNIIEVGSYEGLSLSYIKDLIATNNIKIYSVERYVRKRLIENTSKWGINLIHKSSVNASRDFEDEFFDLIYIDADHAYKSVKEDIQAWYPKLKYGGIIAGHDFNWLDVEKAVNECMPKRIISGRHWYCKKLKIKLV